MNSYGYGPGRYYSYGPVRRLTPVNTVIIAANVILFLIIEFIGSTHDTTLMIRFGASYWPLIAYDHQYWRLFTSAFLHFGLEHLFSNMLVWHLLGIIWKEPWERLSI